MMRNPLQHRAAGEEKGRGKAPLLVATLAFALLVVTGVAAGLLSATAHQETGPAPAELAGYRLVQSIAGPQAVADVNDLHGTDIDIVDAWIAHYQNGGAVWVAQATSEGKARQLLDDMVLRIQDGGSPYWGLTALELQDIAVYSVKDSRQTHYFYQAGTRVVWVAAPPGDEETFLSEAFRKVS